MRRSTLLSNDRYLPIMQAGEKQQRKNSPDQRHQHVRLRIPGIALRAEKFIRPLSKHFCRTPFDQFVRRADRQHDADNHKTKHAPAIHMRTPDQNFARHQRRNKALEEMADLVVRIALDMEQIGNLETERHASIGVNTADDQHHRVYADADVKQCRQRKDDSSPP